MKRIQEALSRMVWLQNENIGVGSGIFDVYGREYENELVSAIKSDISGTWDILRNGTDEEFCELLNSFDEVGEFQEDDTLREIMRIGKRRLESALNKEGFIADLKVGFGILFDEFWNEADPVTEARTFNQVLRDK